ncbi:MAG: hypothetical protein R6X10_17135 [Desulfobacterales bacterium]
MKKNYFAKKAFFLTAAVFMAVWIGMAGCSTDDGDSASISAERGDLVISLTDAEGDFTSYAVDVLSLTLTRKNGAVVHALPLTTRVDFSQYIETSEFLAASTIPSGIYTEATMELDYRNADIWVENANGDAVNVTSILDEDGNPIETLTVSVYLEGSNSLLITPGIPVHLTLDFNLDASNQAVFTDSESPTLTVEPVLLAAIDPESPKTHRLRGALTEVDVDAGRFKLLIRPFFHAFSGNENRFGTLTVTSLDSTVYDIDGTQYEGEAGLAALNDLPALTPVVVNGDLKFHPYCFEAREVRAGSSVPGVTMDVVTGNVISRENNILVIKGASFYQKGGGIIFNDTVRVRIDEDTTVRRQLSAEMFATSDISVGQRITVFGEIANSDVSDLELDATSEKQGVVRLLLTTVKGTVVDDGSPLIVGLQSINARQISNFDFTGTGIDADHDADPENYEIEPGTLFIPFLEENAVVKVRGFVNGFGQAPYDFSAWTIVNVTKEKSFMHVTWAPATTTPFDILSAEEIVLNMDNHGLFHHIGRAGMMINLNDLSSATKILPPPDDQGRYLINRKGSIRFYTSVEIFTAALADYLADGIAVKSLFATGSFDLSTATIIADAIEVKLE